MISLNNQIEKKRKHLLLFVLLLLFSSGSLLAQNFYIIMTLNKEYPSSYLRTRTTWGIPTPIAFEKNEFSPDFGDSWERVGTFGANVRPYLIGNDVAISKLNGFTTCRVLGAAQMFVVAPLFLVMEIQWTNEYNNSGPPYDEVRHPGYIWGFFGFLITGSLTYHLVSKVFLIDALAEYYNTKRKNLDKGLLMPKMDLGYNSMSKSPVLTLNWTL